MGESLFAYFSISPLCRQDKAVTASAVCLPALFACQHGVYSAVKKHMHTRRSLHSREKVGQLSHINCACNNTYDFICVVANTADV